MVRLRPLRGLMISYENGILQSVCSLQQAANLHNSTGKRTKAEPRKPFSTAYLRLFCLFFVKGTFYTFYFIHTVAIHHNVWHWEAGLCLRARCVAHCEYLRSYRGDAVLEGIRCGSCSDPICGRNSSEQGPPCGYQLYQGVPLGIV